MNPVFAFLLAHWGLVITWLVVGTMATRVLDAVAKALPQFPRLTHFAAVVDEVAFDAIDIVVAVGKMIGGTVPPDLKSAAKSAAKGALLVLVTLLFVGCGFFQTQAGKIVMCDAANMAEALALLCPPPVTLLCTTAAGVAYQQACEDAASAGKSQDEATAAGLKAAKVQLAKLQRRGVNLSKESVQ